VSISNFLPKKEEPPNLQDQVKGI